MLLRGDKSMRAAGVGQKTMVFAYTVPEFQSQMSYSLRTLLVSPSVTPTVVQ